MFTTCAYPLSEGRSVINIAFSSVSPGRTVVLERHHMLTYRGLYGQRIHPLSSMS